jgi:hypothetical protein
MDPGAVLLVEIQPQAPLANLNQREHQNSSKPVKEKKKKETARESSRHPA